MKPVSYTLLADGSSDRALMPIVTWLLRHNGMRGPINPHFSELQRLPDPPRQLADRIRVSLDLYPCDLLFVHRDAEREPRAARIHEIGRAVEEVNTHRTVPPVVCVVPVRMQEAWLLFDEIALRRAAGNPRGSVALNLPNVAHLEELPDPKNTLHHLLREASGLSGRRKKNVPVSAYSNRLAELVDDYSPLRALSAFQSLETDIRNAVTANNW